LEGVVLPFLSLQQLSGGDGMWIKSGALVLVLAFAASAHGQQTPEAETAKGSAAAAEDVRPDHPTPQIEPIHTDEDSACPSGVGKPCAFLGGRLYYPDLWKMTQHDRTWLDAMRHPPIVAASVLLVASTVFDIEGTDHCLAWHACRESNPINPKTPDRPRQYATTMAGNALGIYFLGRAKQHGKGNFAFYMLYAISAAHSYFGATGFAVDNPTNGGSARNQIHPTKHF
jgi:hypothetical protein